jgi:hypothetical protein
MDANPSDDGRDNQLVTWFWNYDRGYLTAWKGASWNENAYLGIIEAQEYGSYPAGSGPPGAHYGSDIATLQHYSHVVHLASADIILTFKKGVVLVDKSGPSTVYLGGSYSRVDSMYGATSSIAGHSWYVNGAQVSGANGPTFTYTATALGAHHIQHRVDESSGFWDTLTVTLSVVPQPISASILGFDEVQPNVPNCFFSSTATGGNGNYTYLWKKNGQTVGTNAPSLYLPTGTSDFILSLTVSEPGFSTGSAELHVTVSGSASESACNEQ